MSTITISLPGQIAKKVDMEAKKQGFSTRSEFIRNILRRYLSYPKEEFRFEPFVPKPLEEIRADFEKTGKYNKKFIDSVIKGLSKSSFYER
ncbi:ribbon-helix-helix protein, CopG family [Candidatus Daviesbacteria bacterium]|nr:ribbon-helix-helix protein, CopG family [Candidatus Daviesbacteria bacterium]